MVDFIAHGEKEIKERILSPETYPLTFGLMKKGLKS